MQLNIIVDKHIYNKKPPIVYHSLSNLVYVICTNKLGVFSVPVQYSTYNEGRGVVCLVYVHNNRAGFIRGILRGVRYAKSLRVLFLHRRSPSWTTLVLYSRAVFIFNEPTTGICTLYNV
jgi:hypothetical protein